MIRFNIYLHDGIVNFAPLQETTVITCKEVFFYKQECVSFKHV